MDLITVTPNRPRSPVIVHTPYTGVVVPATVLPDFRLPRDLLGLVAGRLQDTEAVHLSSAFDDLGRRLGSSRQPPSLAAPLLSRLVLDPTWLPLRTATHPSRHPFTRPYLARRRALVERYRAQLLAVVETTGSRFGAACVLNLYTYPLLAEIYEDAHTERPQLCIEACSKHTPSWLVSQSILHIEDRFGATVKFGSPQPLMLEEPDDPTIGLDPWASTISIGIRRDVLSQVLPRLVALIHSTHQSLIGQGKTALN